MKHNFKIGDKIKIKKFSEKEYTNIYSPYFSYKNYLPIYNEYFNYIGIIEQVYTKVRFPRYTIYFPDLNDNVEILHEELELYFDKKIKIKFVKDLIS